MPTLAQLQAEPWWGREIVTVEMQWLANELCRRTGRPRIAAGSKGDTNHLRGAHRSQEWILHSVYCTNRTYTVQSGLTAEQARHVAGFDFTPGSAEQMIAQSKRLMVAVKSGTLEAVRELYCNVDGDQVVDGWNNVANRAATSDSSHLWHWHLTLDRRRCGDRALMERILAIALGLEDDMSGEIADRALRQLDARNALGEVYLRLSTGEGSIPGQQDPDSVPYHDPNNLKAVLAGVTTLAADVAALKDRPVTVTDEQLERVLRRVLGMAPQG